MEAIRGQAPPLPLTGAQQRCGPVSQVLSRKQCSTHLFWKDDGGGNVCPPDLLDCIFFEFRLQEQSGFYKSSLLQRANQGHRDKYSTAKVVLTTLRLFFFFLEGWGFKGSTQMHFEKADISDWAGSHPVAAGSFASQDDRWQNTNTKRGSHRRVMRTPDTIRKLLSAN